MVHRSSPASYGAFAFAYDRALGERFFKAVRGLLDDAVQRHCGPRRTHLDLACGTGLALEHFSKRGWRSTGVDASLPMLRLARNRSGSGPLVAADIRQLPLRGTFALVTCLYDSLNHMMERDDLVAGFRAARAVMGSDSRLMFDMNHPEIYPAVWGLSEPFFANGPGWELEIGTSWHPRQRLGRATVRGFATMGREKVDIRELHEQRAWNEAQIERALREAGLEPLEVLDFDPFEEGGPTVKLFYVCGVKGFGG